MAASWQNTLEFVVESMRYRNLAPLYCDEEMTLCLHDRHGSEVGRGLKDVEARTRAEKDVLDVWIEGPTGRVAVTGTVGVGKTLVSQKPWVGRHGPGTWGSWYPSTDGPLDLSGC